MGIVYDAVAHGADGFRRRVAIKRLSNATDPEFHRLFVNEARIASQLHHAGIVSVVDYGVVDGSPFQVLELVDGVDAAALLRRARAQGARMPHDIALHIACEVAHALAYAHTASGDTGAPLEIVHRDVKPSNIFVSWSGDVKLGDFGIARARDRFSQTTGHGRGTLHYMPPEQLYGGVVDARADIFALGCTLHALVTSYSPLSVESAAQSFHLGQPLALAPDLPPDVRAIIERATQRDPNARYGSAREMADVLGAALAQHLKTAAKTRLIQWLESLSMRADRAAPAAPPTLTMPPMSTMPPTSTGSMASSSGEVGPTHSVGSLAAHHMSGPALMPPYTHSAPRAVVAQPPSSARTIAYVVAGLVGVLGLAALGVVLVFVFHLGSTTTTTAKNDPPDSASAPAVLPPATTTTLAPESTLLTTTSSGSSRPAPAPTTSTRPAPTPSPTTSTTPTSSSKPPPPPPPSPAAVKSVEVSGLEPGVWGPKAPSVTQSLQAKSRSCFQTMPARPGVSVAVNFTLYADGRRERERASPLCHATQGDCRTYFDNPPLVPDNVIQCVQAVVRSTELPPLSAGSRSVGLDLVPKW